MGRKNQIPEFKSIDAEPTNADFTGKESVVGQTDRAQYIIEATGTDLNARIDIEFSNDKVNWNTLPVEPPILLDMTNMSAIVQIGDITWKHLRPKFNDLSAGAAAGTVTARMTASTEGA